VTRGSLLAALAMVMGGCDALPGQGDGADPGGTSTDETCESSSDCPFGERCEGGLCTGEVPPPVVDDGCVSDVDCAADEACAMSTGLCVGQVVDPDPTPEPGDECTTGTTRSCGTKVGRCEYGSQACVGGLWQTGCSGAIEPLATESCNGIDDDCDGVIPEGELDADGDEMRGCEGDCGPSDPTVYLGAAEACDGKDNDCDGTSDDGATAACDDGVFCNGAEACSAGGSCVSGASIECGFLSDVCHSGVCSEVARDCIAAPLLDGTACDDGLYCTLGTSCTAGICGDGSGRDCSGESDQCNAGICDEIGNTCTKQPVAPRPCDDGVFCTVGDTCNAGTCAPGTPRVCAAVGSCMSGRCDVDLDACVDGAPINEGLACDDGLYCRVGEVCTAGTCGGSTARSCAAVADQCNAGVCVEASDTCQKQPYTDGRSCNDGSYCTIGDVCSPTGTCGGAARDCSALADTCNSGACNETADICQKQPRNEGGACTDGQYCTITDVCIAGACSGASRDCSAMADSCNSGTCNEGSDTCAKAPRANGTICDDGFFCTVGDACQGGSCAAPTPRDCSSMADPPCIVGQCNESTNRCVAYDPGTCTCDPNLDGDFDGHDQCDDCDDTNGSIHLGATERCNGLDDDCDGLVDETFDGDTDTYSACATDPLLFDCDDTRSFVNPGAAEACGSAGTGNAIDDNCNGYVDEGCAPCSNTDSDGDGVSQCQGDCAPTDGAITPGKPEVCDGKDTDCNVFTVENCDVSDPCSPLAGAPDICRDDLLCACVLNAAGTCNGNYLCTSFCNASSTGAVGDLCDTGQTCRYDIIPGANVHGCGETEETLGAKAGGVACTKNKDEECRSGNCASLFLGSGGDYCLDFCGSDAYCPAAGTVCRIVRGSDTMDGRCWPTGRPGTGATAVGQSCTLDSACDHGLCTTVGGSTTKVCTEPCCSDGDCGTGFTCGLTGDQVAQGYILRPPSPTNCTTAANCPTDMLCWDDPATSASDGKCVWRMYESTPMCVADVGSQGTRRAGAACTLNRECRSNFCERDLGVCVEVCCSDASCPDGLTCELQDVMLTATRPTSARICVNQSNSDPYDRK
jgi:hypothetical protein